jgi:Ca2+-binding RTX toxin-like protein
MAKQAEYLGKGKFSELVFNAKWVANNWAYADTIDLDGRKVKGNWIEYKVSDPSQGLLKYAELFVPDNNTDQIAEIRWLAPHGGRSAPDNVDDIHDPNLTIMALSGISLDLKTFVDKVTSTDASARYSYLVSLMDGAIHIDGGRPGDQDIEVGKGGAAAVNGGGGDDTVWIWQEKDIWVDGGKGSDTLDFGDQAGGTLARTHTGVTIDLSEKTAANPFGGAIHYRHVENVVGWHGAANKLVGDDQDNTLTSGNFGDMLRGKDGDDTIVVDTYSGHGPRNLFADGGQGRDTLVFWSHTGVSNSLDVAHQSNNTGTFADGTFSKFEIYRAQGDSGGFFFRGTDASEEVYGSSTGDAGDSLFGGGGDDLLDGSFGADTLVGGTGNDTFYIDNRADIVKEKPGEGTDTIGTAFFSAGTYTMPTNIENLDVRFGGGSVIGNALDNMIDGNGSEQAIDGKDGDDTIVGGNGADKLTGGMGSDRFVYSDWSDSATSTLWHNVDVITDFSQTENDKIDLSPIDADPTTAGHQQFDFIGSNAFSGAIGELRVTMKNGETIVEASIDDPFHTIEMKIKFDHAPALAESDFIL